MMVHPSRGVNVNHSMMVHPSPCPTGEEEHPPAGKVPRTGFRLTQLVDSPSSSSSSSNGGDMLNPLDRRRTNDEIHKSIDLCPVMTAFIDTATYQRLRGIKQLGITEYVFMTANHTRFEHSLGVAHLAEKLCRRIKECQPLLECTEKDVLCIKIAGLFHDLGHGPFSHVYEKFVKDSLPNYLQAIPGRRHVYKQTFPHLKKYWKLSNFPSPDHSTKKASSSNDEDDDGVHAFPNLPKSWEHEVVSLMMIDLLLQELGLKINVEDSEKLDEPLEQIGDGVDRMAIRVYGVSGLTDKQAILTSRDFIFIKECICGGRPLPGQEELIGRRKLCQEWMYDIVSNRRSGLDVDKVDYFSRDECRAKGEAGRIDLLMIENAIVARAKCTEPTKCKRCQQPKTKTNDNKHHHNNGGEHVMICYPKKMICATMDFFKKRSSLHTDIYQHKTAIAGTAMICDILCLADAFFKVPTEKGNDESLPISRAMLDATAMLNLKDSVIDLIKHERNNPELRPAQDLIRRFEKHDFYKCAAYEKLDMSNSDHQRIWNLSADEIRSCILASGKASNVTKSDFFIEKCIVHHGQKYENPLDQMRFVEKHYEGNKQCNAMNLPEENLSEAEKQNAIFESLPRAVQVEEVEYDDHIPRNFQKNKILAFSITKEKRSVVKQVFDAWWNNIGVNKIPGGADLATRQRMLVDDSNDDHTSHNDDFEEGDQDEAMQPVLLTQESDDEIAEASQGNEQRHGFFTTITPAKQYLE